MDFGYLGFVMRLPRKTSTASSTPNARSLPARRIKTAALGAALVIFSGFLFLVLNVSASKRVEALAMNGSVARGTPIGEDDLRVIKVADTPGARYIPVAKKQDVIGSLATVALSDGTVLSADLFDRNASSQDSVTVAALVKPGFAPTLIPGNEVTIIGTTTPQASVFGNAKSELGKQAITIGIGKVRGIGVAGNSADTVVSLEVDAKIAADVAAASSAGGLALVAKS
jgi:hypothetical protein